MKCIKCGTEILAKECPECGFMNKIRFIDKTPIEQVKTVLIWIGLGIGGIIVCWGLGFFVISASSHPGLEVSWWANMLFGIPIILLCLIAEYGQKYKKKRENEKVKKREASFSVFSSIEVSSEDPFKKFGFGFGIKILVQNPEPYVKDDLFKRER